MKALIKYVGLSVESECVGVTNELILNSVMQARRSSTLGIHLGGLVYSWWEYDHERALNVTASKRLFV